MPKLSFPILYPKISKNFPTYKTVSDHSLPHETRRGGVLRTFRTCSQVSLGHVQWQVYLRLGKMLCHITSPCRKALNSNKYNQYQPQLFLRKRFVPHRPVNLPSSNPKRKMGIPGDRLFRNRIGRRISLQPCVCGNIMKDCSYLPHVLHHDFFH